MADEGAKDVKPARKAVHEPPAGAETTGTWTANGLSIDYAASGKWIVLRKKEKPAAEIFSVSYVASRDDDRPVTFVFNGGPGASSAYLHMGAVGPSRVVFPADGSLPPMPPRLVANEESWLAFTDLVFVDPVGTGFSRVVEAEAEEQKKKEREEMRMATPRSTSATSATSSRYVSSWAGGSPLTAGGARPCSLPARAMAATASAGSCAWRRRRRASG